MKKKIVILVLLTLTVLNTIVSGFRIFDSKDKFEDLIVKKENAQNLEETLYDISSLDRAISELENERANRRAFHEADKDYSTLKMTEEVLLLLEKNRIRVSNYRLEGEENSEELAVTGEGKTGGIIKLFYDLSFAEPGFLISFLSVDTKAPGKPVSLVMRIAYDWN